MMKFKIETVKELIFSSISKFFLPSHTDGQVRRLKTSMQYKETHYNHENRKREKEYSRLKVTLGQVPTPDLTLSLHLPPPPPPPTHTHTHTHTPDGV